MEPLFSLDKLARITNHNAEVMDQFNRSFLEQTIGTDLPRLVEGVRQQDYHLVFQSAHRMKTSVDVYQVNTIRTDLHRLEQSARTRTELQSIPGLAKKVAETLMEVAHQLKADYTNQTSS